MVFPPLFFDKENVVSFKVRVKYIFLATQFIWFNWVESGNPTIISIENPSYFWTFLCCPTWKKFEKEKAVEEYIFLQKFICIVVVGGGSPTRATPGNCRQADQ